MRKILVAALFIICSKVSFAQSVYNRAIGLKVPGGFSVTYKKFITPVNNIEAQATISNKGFRVSGLYEFNFYSFDDVAGLSWFAGPGAHIGFWKNSDEKNNSSKADIGVDGIIGLDYKFNDAPINISLDWQPSVTLVGSTGFTPVYGGIAVRYTF
jgi:hypothetical protein